VTGPRYFDETFQPKQPDYFRDADRPKKANWRQHEKDISERAGEPQVAGSGNQPGRPGDTMGTQFLRDGKATRGAGITIKAEWLRKIVGQALSMGRVPLIEVRMEGADLPVPTDWVLLPAEDFQEILDGSKQRPSRESGGGKGGG
jgi:hypothetical protein